MSVTCDMCKVTVQKATSRANCKSLDQTDHISWQNKSLSIRFYVHLYLYSQNTNLCLNFFVSNTLEWIKLGHIIVQELLLEEQNCNDERLRISIMCAGKKICRVPTETIVHWQHWPCCRCCPTLAADNETLPRLAFAVVSSWLSAYATWTAGEHPKSR